MNENLFEKMFEEYYSKINMDHVPDDMKEGFKDKIKTYFYNGATTLLFGIRSLQRNSCCHYHGSENVEKFLDEFVDGLGKHALNENLDELYGPLRRGENKEESKESHLGVMMELLKELGFTELPTPPMVVDPSKAKVIN